MSAGQLEIEVRGLVREINQAVKSRATRGLNIMRNAALDVLGKNGSGRVYKRHVASAPGQPPAPDTGNLRRNWRLMPIAITSSGKGDGIRIYLRMRSDVPYAMFLEKGTRKMAARPFKERIRTKARPQIVALMGGV